MGLLFDGIELTTVRNAIGDRLGFDGIKSVMDRVHGDGSIYGIANEMEPRRAVADKCFAYSRRHGMLVDLLIGVANRTDIADELRLRLTAALREAFTGFEDVAPPVRAIATAWPSARVAATSIAGRAQTFNWLIADAVDSVERPDVLKAMRDSALKLYSSTQVQWEQTPSALGDALEAAVETAGKLLARLSRPPLNAIEARWLSGLQMALAGYRSALATQDVDKVRSARNVLVQLLDATTPNFDDDLLACVPSLSFERVAVVLRDAGLGDTIGVIIPAILRCHMALSHRWENHVRWASALDSLEDLRATVPADSPAGSDGWLVDLCNAWPSARTVVKTLCLLSADPAIQAKESSLADIVGDAMAAAVHSNANFATLSATLDDYLDFAAARTDANGVELEKELDKLVELRTILQAIRSALASGSGAIANEQPH